MFLHLRSSVYRFWSQQHISLKWQLDVSQTKHFGSQFTRYWNLLSKFLSNFAVYGHVGVWGLSASKVYRSGTLHVCHPDQHVHLHDHPGDSHQPHPRGEAGGGQQLAQTQVGLDRQRRYAVGDRSQKDAWALQVHQPQLGELADRGERDHRGYGQIQRWRGGFSSGLHVPDRAVAAVLPQPKPLIGPLKDGQHAEVD